MSAAKDNPEGGSASVGIGKGHAVGWDAPESVRSRASYKIMLV